jgi:radical SAM superfamily enzyme YgiQ (UPF0313 family)
MKIALVKPTVPETNAYRKYFPERGKATKIWYSKRIEFGEDILKRRTYVSTHHRTSTALMIIASVLDNDGHKVKYYQEGMLKDKGKWNIKEVASHDALIITVPTQSFPEAVRVVEEVKKLNSNIFTVIGGYHATYEDADAAKYFDVVITYEGEETVSELMSKIEKNQDYSDIKGMTFLKQGKLIRTPRREIKSFDNLPSPGFHLLDKITKDNTTSEMYTSRGCVYGCKFCFENCISFWKKPVYRSIDKVIEDVQHLQRHLGANYLFFKDSTFNMNFKRMNDLCDALRKNFDMSYSCFTRGDLTNKKVVDTLKKTSFVSTYLGFETASDKIAALMRKDETFSQQYRAMKLFNKANIFTNISLMVGFPGENKRSIEFNKKILKKLHNELENMDSWPRIFIPYPGTEIYKNPEKFGVKILTHDFEKWIRGCEPIIELKNLSKKEIKQAALDLYKIGTENAITRANLK